MPTLEIDGKEVTVEPGTSVLDAAREAGVTVPTFCYHPGLSVPANCRMCLVEIDMGRGSRLMPACYTAAGDGMQVHTESGMTREAQASVLEFILLNHPVDCPICDQAGECNLQDHYYSYSARSSRLHDQKVRKPKAKVVGPHVILDAERCILCTRCVRFCDEITRTSELRVINRGQHSEIGIFPGIELDNRYSLCTADICPVGALTNREFRFKARVWFTRRAQTVCEGCSRGCSMWADSLRNEIERMVPRENPEINGWWACDEGRLAYRRFEQGRILAGWTTETGSRRELDPAAAYAELGRRLRKLIDSGGAGQVAILAHPSWSCEDHFVLGRLVAELDGAPRVYLGGRGQNGYHDDILIRADKNANRRGAREVLGAAGVTPGNPEQLRQALERGEVKLVLVLGGEHDLSDAVLEALRGVSELLGIAPWRTPLTDLLAAGAPTRTVFERSGTFVNFEGRIQRFEKARDHLPEVGAPWRALVHTARAAGIELGYGRLAEVFAAMTAAVPAFAGVRGPRDLGEHGVAIATPTAA